MSLHHVAIWTDHLEPLRAFYETYFLARSGPKYTNPNTGFESYFLLWDTGAKIEIMTRPGIPQTRNDPLAQFTGLIHIALSVGSNDAVDELTTRLERDGYRVVSAPRTTGDGYYESVVLDPDGNRVEITV